MKGVGGNYETYVEGLGIVVCRAKGILRYRKTPPLIGDDVTLTVDETGAGNIEEILPRKNALVRPAVANVDQALICFNKQDLADASEAEQLASIYRECAAGVFVTQASKPGSADRLREALHGKTTVLAGPSGVGKSTIMNALHPDANMEVGGLSRKILRGKQTTRHTQLFQIESNTFLCDTPGFSSLYLPDITPDELADYYPEFASFSGQCRYPDCIHRREPECAVRAAVENGTIAKERYDSYCLLYEELSGTRIIYSRKPKHSDGV